MMANSGRARRPVNKRCDFPPLSTICHFHFRSGPFSIILFLIVAFLSKEFFLSFFCPMPAIVTLR